MAHEVQYLHIMVLTQPTQVAVQLLHSLLVGFDAFALQAILELEQLSMLKHRGGNVHLHGFPYRAPDEDQGTLDNP